MKQLTITVSDEFFDGLRQRVGERGAGAYLERLARESVLPKSLEQHYREEAQDDAAEQEAAEWVGAEMGDTLRDEDWIWLRDAKR